jgi:hypothetical protein
MKKLYYDVGEIGWSMYLAAHIRYLHEKGEPAAVACAKAKTVFYRGTAAEILPIPEEWKEKFGGFPSDGGHLYNPRTRRRIKDHNLLAEPFRKAYPDHDTVTRYGTFPGQRTFAPDNHSALAEAFCREAFSDRSVIMVFPRCRTSKFKGRNIPGRQWEKIISEMCNTFPEDIVASFGSRNGSYTDLEVNSGNFMNLAGRNDSSSLDWMVALCNTGQAKAAVGNQSGTVKMTLLCKTPTFIFGHEEKRHTEDENWSKTRVAFHRVGPVVPWDRKSSILGYRIKNLEKLIAEITEFIKKGAPKRPLL